MHAVHIFFKFFIQVYVCLCTCGRERVLSSGAGVTDGCELIDTVLGTELRFSRRAADALTTRPFLQPHVVYQ